MIREYIAAIITVTEYHLRIVWSATPLWQSEVLPVHAIKVCEGVKAEPHTFLDSTLGVGGCCAVLHTSIILLLEKSLLVTTE